MDEIKQVWLEWEIEGLIGQGSRGKVYKVRRQRGEEGFYYAAAKVIQVPWDESEVSELLNSGMTYEGVREYYEKFSQNLLDEIKIMEAVKSAPNIVKIEDFHLRPKRIGCTLYLRMELLQSLNDCLEESGELPVQEIVKMGIDLASALDVCEQSGIIHRDIKPDNIFRNHFGDYKLGDFGVARQSAQTSVTLLQKGTDMYMAPELYRGEKYDNRVDIYSLGITLYRLLNHGRFPFMPPITERIRPGDMEKAMEQRLCGTPVPPPQNADRQLSEIILKMCAFSPEDRFQNAREVREALRHYREGVDHEQTTQKESSAAGVLKSRRVLVGAAAAVVLLAVGIGAAAHQRGNGGSVKEMADTEQTKEGEQAQQSDSSDESSEETFEMSEVGAQEGKLTDGKYIVSQQNTSPEVAVIQADESAADYSNVMWDATDLSIDLTNEQGYYISLEYTYVEATLDAELELFADSVDRDFYQNITVGDIGEIQSDSGVWKYRKVTYQNTEYESYSASYILITERSDNLRFQCTLDYSGDIPDVQKMADEQLLQETIDRIQFVSDHYQEITAMSPEGVREIQEESGAVTLLIDKNAVKANVDWSIWSPDSLSAGIERGEMAGDYEFAFSNYSGEEYESVNSDISYEQENYENVSLGGKISLDVNGMTVHCLPLTYQTDYGLRAEYMMWTDVEGVTVTCDYSWSGEEGEEFPSAENVMKTAFTMASVGEVDPQAAASRGAGVYDFDHMEAAIEQCYKGQDQNGADIYYAANAADDYAGYIRHLNNSEKMEFLSVVGSAVGEGNEVTITDEANGDQESFTVQENGDGTISLTGTDGETVLLRASYEEEFIEILRNMEELGKTINSIF